jgi:hypothetical protein
MDYHTSSRNRTRKSSTEPSPPSSSSRHSSSSTSESASIRYYTALAGSSTPYRSPYEPTYTQDEDRRAEPSTASASRASAVSASSRSANLHPSYEPPSPPTKDSLSTGSLSSGGSLYTSSPTTQNYQGTPGGTGSSRGKTMSSVSHDFDLSPYVSISSTFTSYSPYLADLLQYLLSPAIFYCLRLYGVRATSIGLDFALHHHHLPCLRSDSFCCQQELICGHSERERATPSLPTHPSSQYSYRITPNRENLRSL